MSAGRSAPVDTEGKKERKREIRRVLFRTDVGGRAPLSDKIFLILSVCLISPRPTDQEGKKRWRKKKEREPNRSRR